MAIRFGVITNASYQLAGQKLRSLEAQSRVTDDSGKAVNLSYTVTPDGSEDSVMLRLKKPMNRARPS